MSRDEFSPATKGDNSNSNDVPVAAYRHPVEGRARGAWRYESAATQIGSREFTEGVTSDAR
jgi:hypothetical protein